MSSVSGHVLHWQKRLANRPPVLELPTLRLRAPESFHPEWLSFSLEERQCKHLRLLLTKLDAKPLEGVLAAFVAVLYRTTRQSDLVIGVQLKDSFGPLRLDLSKKHSFSELVEMCKRGVAEIREHPVSIGELARAVGSTEVRDIFQVIFSVGVPRMEEREDIDLVFALKSPLVGNEISADLIYDAGRFETEAAKRMIGHMETLTKATIKSPKKSIGALPFLTDEERWLILNEWNAKQVDYPKDVCLHELFEQRVDANPRAIAAVFNGETLTYGDLEERSNRIANHLRELGVGPETMVGACIDRSFEMIAALLGIAKAGGAYLPMDPAYPRERLLLMLKDSKVGFILTQKHLKKILPRTKAKTLCVDDPKVFAEAEDTRPQSGVQPHGLAYCIYTSGSTGKPKGVLLDHCGRVNNFLDFNRRFNICEGDSLIALASLSFDMCAYDVFGTLAAGATIVMPRPHELQDPVAWSRLMNERRVTTWHSAPAMLKMLVDHLEVNPHHIPASLSLVLLGGDWIPVSLPDRLRKLVDNVKVISMGGATECSMDSTIFEIHDVDSEWNSIPYGEPMANQLAYVLDEDLQPLPIGAPGELFLGGDGVGRGYHERPELTAERFLDNPFVSKDVVSANGSAPRMYRTGDLARWMPNGNLELLGRIDNQVKIRGYRIELGEIEARLCDHPAVREGVVVALPDASGEKRLVGYVVQDPEWNGAEFESDLGAEQITHWRVVYDNAYASSLKAEAEDPTFNITSWDSSYTGKLIPAEEMRAWVDQTVERIAAHQPEEILEIGCGMGLLLFQLAPKCKRYVGIDFSQVALDYVKRHVKERNLEQVELLQRMADDLDDMAPQSFDAVVLNSIVFDFPSMDYLTDVLDRAVSLVRRGGTVFVGDVRSRPLLEAFQTSTQLYRADDELPAAQLAQRVERLVHQEEELVVDPGFFHWLKTRVPAIGGVEIQLRRGAAVNEMNAFRYDVRLHVGPIAKAPAFEAELDGEKAVCGFKEIKQALRAEPESLVVHDLWNGRVLNEMRAMECLEKPKKFATVADIRAELENRAENEGCGVDPEELSQLAATMGYSLELRFACSGHPGRCDAAFRPLAEAEKHIGSAFDDRPAVDLAAKAAAFGNSPVHGKLAQRLGKILREFLSQDLPDYMVPAIFVPLESMPLSRNGKVDRKCLPEPTTVRPEGTSAYAAPTSDMHEVLCDIWQDVMGLERIGIDDAFLELGGHSILAVQIQARLTEVFPFPVELRAIFETETVSGLAEHLRSVGTAAGIDADEVARLLRVIQGLSDEEVSQHLAAGA